jgi:hypothetical protein
VLALKLLLVVGCVAAVVSVGLRNSAVEEEDAFCPQSRHRPVQYDAQFLKERECPVRIPGVETVTTRGPSLACDLQPMTRLDCCRPVLPEGHDSELPWTCFLNPG